MENQDNLTPEQVAEIEAMPLHEAAGKILGKEFPDVASAAKALKDTFGYVGKAGESLKLVESVMAEKGFKTPKEAVDYINTSLKNPPAPKEPPKDTSKPEIDPKEFVPRKEFDKTNFYGSHPELKGYENLVETFAKANPEKTRDEILQMDDFKQAFDGAKAQKQKSILHSNPKIGAVEDSIGQAREKIKSGNPADIREAEKLATKSVMEVYDI